MKVKNDKWDLGLEKIDLEEFRKTIAKAVLEIQNFEKRLGKEVALHPTSIEKWAAGSVSPPLKKKHEVLNWLKKNKKV